MKNAFMKLAAVTLVTAGLTTNVSAQGFTPEELQEATQTTNDLKNGCQTITDKLFTSGNHGDLGQEMATCLATISNEMTEVYEKMKPQVAFGSKLQKVNSITAGLANGEIINKCDLPREEIKRVAPNLSGESGIKKFMALTGQYVDGCSETMRLIKKAANQQGVGDLKLNEGSNDMVTLFSYIARGWESKPHKDAAFSYLKAQQDGQPIQLEIIPNPSVKKINIPTIK